MNTVDHTRTNVVGLGLIGGSIALALRERGWEVYGSDLDDEVSRRAQYEGIILKSASLRKRR